MYRFQVKLISSNACVPTTCPGNKGIMYPLFQNHQAKFIPASSKSKSGANKFQQTCVVLRVNAGLRIHGVM